jgi:hypothetical protein
MRKFVKLYNFNKKIINRKIYGGGNLKNNSSNLGGISKNDIDRVIDIHII